ncbi:MAG: hypothetical protein FWE09_00190 [Treponema sp.]|nr:hypothetical protein [Treponema sp.]
MKPILFSTKMVQSLLNTKPDVWPAQPIDEAKPFKSQTRRAIKPQPRDAPEGARVDPYDGNRERFTVWTRERKMCLDCGGNVKGAAHWKPPFLPGEILYARETWADIPETAPGNLHYRASATEGDLAWFRENNWKWRPSIHMPREAARLFLEVKAVRAERLRDITASDKIAEGFCDCCRSYPCGEKDICDEQCFMKTWDSIYVGRGYSWGSNPWVWVYELGRVER